ncbi:MAG: serine--tRNA ligase [Candidatus Lloydbacteria bacterium RIFCSPHIGHO2_02_FULL_54_17]|uniref:Serine--tRNA ligase n=1 Tax=Candidatus Lloydbacteria bacterium RIFCSPHIGHO2_02_FULL_54_17 TaxID=1798664 RepID=A0A1G2DFW5_9BACT|nr:MAG: serine--tRNA ligase [Candidatus Lloydbacteria bacterium RIFCSPHIGHO2_01_FULL_54_11]OGZ12466.1 MAG: serine--tRNA ligase [Candidatus Lloydbacteria bacterium RIFCSPHIGHO2_02_FULL_54_17]OGZ14724.1 MAG: serine--tRNA ligase [Candidatus Lloydbacteria bacterium RIFCSPLOWO2_01_FULL_54_18]OGZ16752.1 MAG: serine--tRNA ligase [Candidatus Lloydbacteria bacterium RIFCSPLOWO2_02_FULL_54_12]
MLDIKFIRENPELIREAARKKHSKFEVDDLLLLEERRLDLLAEVEKMRAEQNIASENIAKATDPVLRQQTIDEMKVLKERLTKKDEELKKTMEEWRALMLLVPNVPDVSVPDGESDKDNQSVKTWGEKPNFSFTPKDHIEIMEKLGMVDFERGAKVHGFRGYFLTGDGARLSFAIWNYAMNFFSAKKFTPVIPPVIVRKANLYGTGHLPGDVEDYYMTQDGDALAGTAEIPVMGLHADEIFDEGQLPRRYLGFSPCFRREAGSHGKDIKGLIRVHEFFKLEQVILCEANHETSVRFHDEINRNTEEFIESLGIPYRTVINCGADLGQGQVKKYDIELWVPKENTYREISSASYFHDFQTRRFNIRYRDGAGKLHYTHSLNSTAIPTPRVLVSLVENYQDADGSVRIPDILQPYMGGKKQIA